MGGFTTAAACLRLKEMWRSTEPRSGFIDFHTHMDAQLLWDPLATSSCFHGVTTLIPGNCGLSLAPCRPEDRDHLIGSFVRVEAMPSQVLKEAVKWEWQSFPEYLARLRQRLGVNVASLIGHCALRQFVMGEESSERAATPTEVEQMKDLLREGMRAGAIGFSTNQNRRHMREDGRPIASRLATDEEILELAGVLGELNRGSVQISRGTLGGRVLPIDTVLLNSGESSSIWPRSPCLEERLPIRYATPVFLMGVSRSTTPRHSMTCRAGSRSCSFR